MTKEQPVKNYTVEATIIASVAAKSREEAIDQLTKVARMHLPLSIQIIKKSE